LKSFDRDEKIPVMFGKKPSMTKLPFLSVLFILWAGLILGVSFIATPVKFMAQHLTMPVALEIGKAHS
jgi:hypothetical protein